MKATKITSIPKLGDYVRMTSFGTIKGVQASKTSEGIVTFADDRRFEVEHEGTGFGASLLAITRGIVTIEVITK